MLPRGEWRKNAAGDGRTAAFHLSSLYSPVGWFAWSDAAKYFEQAQKNPALLQVFVNTVQGETWTLLGEAPDWQKLYDRREDYRIGVVPHGGLFLTAGADVQKDRIEVEIAAWGRGKESWSVDYRAFEGDTSRPAVWEKLTGLLNETFTTASGLELPILQLAIDSGFATTEVYQWARRQGAAQFVAGQIVTPEFVKSQWSSAAAGSNGRLQNSAIIQQPGLVVSCHSQYSRKGARHKCRAERQRLVRL
jgi:phage terminase large subunit GpA-like protein